MTRTIERQTDLLNFLMKHKSPNSVPGLKEFALNWALDMKVRESVLRKIAEIGGKEAVAALNSISRKSDDQRIVNMARELAGTLENSKKEYGFAGVLPMAEGSAV